MTYVRQWNVTYVNAEGAEAPPTMAHAAHFDHPMLVNPITVLVGGGASLRLLKLLHYAERDAKNHALARVRAALHGD